MYCMYSPTVSNMTIKMTVLELLLAEIPFQGQFNTRQVEILFFVLNQRLHLNQEFVKHWTLSNFALYVVNCPFYFRLAVTESLINSFRFTWVWLTSSKASTRHFCLLGFSFGLWLKRHYCSQTVTNPTLEGAQYAYAPQYLLYFVIHSTDKVL
jgi:hypothetical protein